MINLITLQDRRLDKLATALKHHVQVRCTSYERLFRDQRVPAGHLVLADLDMLTQYERETVVVAADAARTACPEIHILNDPRTALERFPLLRMLNRQGINNFAITRIDDGQFPKRYPVFIRSEDDHQGVDTELLHTEQEFAAAVKALSEQGKILKRRVAIEYCAERCPDGLFRKYGVINVGGDLIPQHVLLSEDWVVKRLSREKTQADYEENLAFVQSNPHREAIAEIFKLANIDYGRVDYTVVDGQVQVYEINMHPRLGPIGKPGPDSARSERRHLTRKRLVDAFQKLDTSYSVKQPVEFDLPVGRRHLRPWKTWQRRSLLTLLNDYPSVKAIVPRRYW